MTPILVETLRLDGRVAHRTRAEGDRLRIGRAYENDVILDDGYVSPHQAELYRDPEGDWYIRDGDSLNGTWHSRRGWVRQDQRLASGDEVHAGRTRLRVILPGHEVAPTLRDTPRPRWLKVLDRPLVAIAALAVAATLTGYLQTLESTEPPGWADWGAPAATALLIMLVWAGAWAMAGKVIRHRFVIAGHAAAAGLAWLAADGLNVAAEYALFWSDGETIAQALAYGGGALLGGTLIHASLLFATQLRWTRALATGQGTAWALLATLAVIQAENQSSFDASPDYATELKPPILSWQPAESRKTFSEAVGETFEDIE